ncbi:MAG: energy transducer TonB, partial [Bacteroidetes bacterium]|nr:energy transducer TonB [Bacteroidota bacterium]
MTREKRNKIKAIAGSIIFHIAILVALIFLGLSTPLPLPGEEGVEVNLGSSDVGMGNIQEESPAPSTPPPPRPQPAEPQEEVVKEEVITQEVEEAPAIVEEEKPKEKKPEEQKPVEQE